jgi:hypothetical protein
MGTISGTTHIRTVFSFSPGIGRHFTGNELCSSDDSFNTTLSHLVLIYDKQCLLLIPEAKIQSNQVWRMREPENGCPSSYPVIRKFPVQKDTNMMGRVRWCTV